MAFHKVANKDVLFFASNIFYGNIDMFLLHTFF